MTKETKTKKSAEAAEQTKGFDLQAALGHYREHSKIQENGVRHIDKETISKRLESVHGVDMDMVHKYHKGMMDERSAIAELTAEDLEHTIVELRKQEDHAEAVKAATASTSFWRHDGTETLTVIGEDTSKDTTIDEGGNVVPVMKHGRIRTSISGNDGIHRQTTADVSKKISALFG